MPHETKRKVPAAALQFAVEPPEIESASEPKDGATRYAFSMEARTAGIANHAYWGRSIHDLGGMRVVGQSIPVDYCHDSKEVIGFADRFDPSEGSLTLSGALVSLADTDRAAEIARKRAAGVPYQASVMMARDGIVYEDVPEGASTMVNGQTVDGPLVVFRQWGLRGVAVLPYGSDPNTSIDFAAGDDGEVEVSVLTFKAPTMTDPVVTPPAKPAETATPAQKTGADYLSLFGDLGGRWFAEGKSFDEAQQLFTADLKTRLTAKDQQLAAKDEVIAGKDRELADLKQKFAAAAGGEPVSFSTTETPAAKTEAKLQFSGLGEGAAKLAASIKLPKPAE
jgi:hypothetical protein